MKLVLQNFMAIHGKYRVIKMDENEIRGKVRERYAKIAQSDSCCEPTTTVKVQEVSESIGYTKEELKSIPNGANIGQGCGNPIAHASIRLGEVVVDLGSGTGIDCFLAAQKVGKSGKVIGVDMTPVMLEKARKFAKDENFDNVEFRLGEIEHLPIADNTADLIISNCVIVLVPDKSQTFKEIFRVLKPGGRMIVSDLVLEKELPDHIKNNPDYFKNNPVPLLLDDYLKTIRAAGLEQIEHIVNYSQKQKEVDIASINVNAVKPN